MTNAAAGFTLLSSRHAPAAWQWPLDVSRYDRTPSLTPRELAALDRRARFPQRFGHWSPLFLEEFDRLARPIKDALEFLQLTSAIRGAVQRVFVQEMHRRRNTYWAWTPEHWHEIVGASRTAYQERGVGSRSYARNGLLCVAYLLCNYHQVHALGKYDRVSLAIGCFVGKSSMANWIEYSQCSAVGLLSACPLRDAPGALRGLSRKSEPAPGGHLL
jgi:hypothetical protein